MMTVIMKCGLLTWVSGRWRVSCFATWGNSLAPTHRSGKPSWSVCWSNAISLKWFRRCGNAICVLNYWIRTKICRITYSLRLGWGFWLLAFLTDFSVTCNSVYPLKLIGMGLTYNCSIMDMILWMLIFSVDIRTTSVYTIGYNTEQFW